MNHPDLKAAAAAYIAERFASSADPAYAERLLMPGGDRDFLLSLMAGFAAGVAAEAIREVIEYAK